MHPFIFTLGVFRFGRKDSEMNNKIKPNENGTFKIDARIQIRWTWCTSGTPKRGEAEENRGK